MTCSVLVNDESKGNASIRAMSRVQYQVRCRSDNRQSFDEPKRSRLDATHGSNGSNGNYNWPLGT